MITTPTTGRLGRLGAWTADHRRAVIVAWCAAVLLLGALAPFADRALSGAGWEAPRSESIDARRALESAFPGRGAYALQVVVGGAPVDDPATQRVLARVRSTLLRDPAVAGVLMPRAGGTIAPDHRTAIVTGLAGAPPRAMVEAAGRVGDALARLIFDKPLAELDRSERAELNFLRALKADDEHEDQHEPVATERSIERGALTLH